MRSFVRIAFLLILACSLPSHAAVIVEHDDAGQTLRLPQAARRIISLAPSITELAFAAGAGDRIVGAVEYSDFPAAALTIPRIGNNQKLDLELIASLKPDLVLVWYHGNGQRELERLVALGVPMFYLEPKRFEDIPLAIERIGKLADTRAEAKVAASDFRQRYNAIRAANVNKTPVNVFYQIWSQPLMTVNGSQLISSTLRLCGGVNVFATEKAAVPTLSKESVLAANPQVMFSAHEGGPDNKADARRDPQAPAFSQWQPYRSMQAVRDGQLWTLNGDHISRHGPRILDAASAMCSALDSVRAK